MSSCRVVNWTRSLLLASLIGFSLVPHARAQAPSSPWYTTQDLNPHSLLDPPVAREINNAGEIAGYVYTSRYVSWLLTAQAAVFRNGDWVLIDDLADPVPFPTDSFYPTTRLFGINDLGQAVGYMSTIISTAPNDTLNQGVTLSPQATELAPLSIAPDVFIEGINNSGRIVGSRNDYLDTYPDYFRAFAHDLADGSEIDLDVLLPTPREESMARDVNDAGDVAGVVYLNGVPGYRAFLYRENSSQLEVLYGTNSDHMNRPFAINNRRQIVGQGLLAGVQQKAVVFDANDGTLSGLPTPPGTLTSLARDINDRGEVVGSMNINPIGERAFLYRNGQLLDVNDLVPPGSPWTLREAVGINEQGQIIAFWDRPGPPYYRFGHVLLTPTHQRRITDLIEAVQALQAAGVLNGGNTNALVTKLEGAIAQIDKGNVGPAVDKIEAFVNQVQAFIQSGKLTPAQGQPLIDGANGIIATLKS